jgi:hypothetical protein
MALGIQNKDTESYGLIPMNNTLNLFCIGIKI